MVEKDDKLIELMDRLEENLLQYPEFLFLFLYWFINSYFKYTIPDSKEKYYLLLRMSLVKDKRKELHEMYEEDLKNYDC